MTYEIILALFVFALVTSITPGPNNLMLMASGTNYGLIRTLPHMLGVGIGFMVMIFLVGIGLMRFFEIVPYSYEVLKFCSIAYLLYLAWKIATASPTNGDVKVAGKPFTFMQAALFQWVNPKAWAMALTAISTYTPENRPITSVLVVVIAFGLSGIVSCSSWTVLGTQIRRFLNNPLRLRLFNYTAGILLVVSLLPVMFPGLH